MKQHSSTPSGSQASGRPQRPAAVRPAAGNAARNSGTPTVRITRAPLNSKGTPTVIVTMPSNDVDALMRVMLDLRQVIIAENEALKRGLPPATGEEAHRKDTLSATFRLLFRKVLRKGARPLDPNDARRLYDLGVEIKAMAEENSARLQASMEVREQRVQAVMQALNTHPANRKPGYGSQGATVQSLRTRFVDYGKDVLA